MTDCNQRLPDTRRCRLQDLFTTCEARRQAAHSRAGGAPGRPSRTQPGGATAPAARAVVAATPSLTPRRRHATLNPPHRSHMETIQAHRDFYAHFVVQSAGSANPRLIEAFATTPREHYLGPGP